jgi:hypothetical protein
MKKKKKQQKSSNGRGSPALVEASSPAPAVKLDLGCGQNLKEGFEGVDLYGDKAKHKVDLFKFPWPFKDNSVDEIFASHLLEHIPAREVEMRDIVVSDATGDKRLRENGEKFLGQDMLFAFIDECYRVLKMDGWMEMVVPSGRSNRAFWDPTHRRFFMQETFCYFNRDWRTAQKLDHYRIKAHLVGDVGQTMDQAEGLRAIEVQTERYKTLWNVTIDWWAKLKKMP